MSIAASRHEGWERLQLSKEGGADYDYEPLLSSAQHDNTIPEAMRPEEPVVSSGPPSIIGWKCKELDLTVIVAVYHFEVLLCRISIH